MKKEILRTYPIKSLTIFLAISFVVSLAMLILFIFLKDEPWVIRILVFICCGLFVFASGFMLINQLLFYVGVDEENLYKHAFFARHVIPLKKIDQIVNKDGFYSVYVQGKKICYFATNTKEGSEIIVFLEKKGVKIEW